MYPDPGTNNAICNNIILRMHKTRALLGVYFIDRCASIHFHTMMINVVYGTIRYVVK
jgi:hypothetical protein